VSIAIASQPDWTVPYSKRIDGTQSQRNDYIDISGAVGLFRVVRFRRLVQQWRSETYYLSSMTAKSHHPAFKEIVEMGELAVPWIIEELRNHRDFLFVALHLIVKGGPMPVAPRGKPHKLIDEWLQWAERENIHLE
jgi:hypothetical protein